jgi:hypothetical protein
MISKKSILAIGVKLAIFAIIVVIRSIFGKSQEVMWVT